MKNPHQSEAYCPDELRECGCPIDGDEQCEECCEHGDMEDGQCLDCGADRTEELMAMAYDHAKDLRKYGDV